MTGMGIGLAHAAGQVANLLSLTWRCEALLGRATAQLQAWKTGLVGESETAREALGMHWWKVSSNRASY
jgi:hypothetical protein